MDQLDPCPPLFAMNHTHAAIALLNAPKKPPAPPRVPTDADVCRSLDAAFGAHDTVGI